MRRFGALAAAAVALSACALATATPPSVDVMNVQLTGIGLVQQQLSVTLCVTNPNKTELDFRQVTADLDVSGQPFASGVSDMAVRLPPLSSTAVPFTVVTTLQNVGAQLGGILNRGTIDYRLHGTVALAGALGIRLPYSRSGRLDPLAAGLQLADASPGTSACAAPAPVIR